MAGMDPTAMEGWVSFDPGERPSLYEPAEAEALAMNLLSAASKARAYEMAAKMEDVNDGTDDTTPEDAEF